MKKSLIIAASLAIASSANAASGLFGSFINVSTNGTAQWYDIEGAGGAPEDFGSKAFGTFNPSIGNTLVITGGEALTFKNSGSDVFGAELDYSIQPVGGTHSFTVANLSFTSNATFTAAGNGTSYTGVGDQQWSDILSIDMLSGLSNGDYEVQVFVKARSSDGDHFHSNGGANYTATFTVIPEPSSLAFIGLTGLALIARRRR